MNNDSSLQESFQDERILCAKCGSIPEDILILNCDHNLCTTCAIKIIQRDTHRNIESPKIIKCDICGKQTKVEEASMESLLKSVNASTLNEPESNEEQESSVLSTANERYCKIHDEVALYYCFSCQGNPLCSECLANESHRDHDVVLIKKANKILKDKINEKLTDMECQARSMELQCNEAEKRKRILLKECAYAKDEIASMFNKIKDVLSQVEKNVMEEVDRKYITYENTLANICDTCRYKYDGMQEKIVRYNELLTNPSAFIDVWEEINVESTIDQKVVAEFPEAPKISFDNDKAQSIITLLHDFEPNAPAPEKPHDSDLYYSPKMQEEPEEYKPSQMYKTPSYYNKMKHDTKSLQTARTILKSKYL